MMAGGDNFSEFSHALDNFKNDSSQLLEECKKQFQELYNTHSEIMDELESKAANLSSILASCQESEKEINQVIEKSSKEINEYLEAAKTQADAVAETQVKASNICTELKAYEEKIFGYIRIDKKEITQREFNQIDDPDNKTNENGVFYELTREKIPGLKDEITQLVDEYKGFIKNDKEEASQRNESISRDYLKIKFR